MILLDTDVAVDILRLGLLDALIGHTAIGLNEPLATFNLKHYGVIAALKTIQPY